MQFSWPIFFGSLATGLIGVIVSVVSTIAYNRWAELRRVRVDCFRQLCRFSPSDDEYFRAFSEAPAVFYNRPRVIAAHLKVVECGNLVGDEMCDFIMEVVLTLDS